MTQRLRRLLRESGKSLGELSRLSGVGADQLSRFLHGKDLYGTTLDKLMDALGLEVAPRKRPRRK